MSIRLSLPILATLTVLSACEGSEGQIAPHEIRGCYFSFSSGPIHVGRNVFQTENQRILDRFLYHPQDWTGRPAAMVVEGVKIAAFDHETGALSGWFSLPVPRPLRYQSTTRIEIEPCEDSFCFRLPTGPSGPILKYRKDDCNGAFAMP